MAVYKCKGLQGREDAIQQILNQIKNKNLPKITIITGGKGSGKSYILHNILKSLPKKSFLTTEILINEYDDLVPLKSLKIGVNGIDFSVGVPYKLFSLNASISFGEKSFTEARLKNLLKPKFKKNILIIINDFDVISSTIRGFLSFIIENLDNLQISLNKNIHVILTCQSDNIIPQIILTQPDVEHINLIQYDENDILSYIKRKHVVEPVQLKEKIKDICKIINGNLFLLDFLYADLIIRGDCYAITLKKLVESRLEELKNNSSKINLTDTDVENVVLSSAISLRDFSSTEITNITKYNPCVVDTSLLSAVNYNLVQKNENCLYCFPSKDVQSVLLDLSLHKRKEWTLEYYNYYTDNEQDEYYFRGQYLYMFLGEVNQQVFSLFCLAYISAFKLKDGALMKNINDTINKLCNGNEKECFYIIQEYCDLINYEVFTSDSVQNIDKLYINLNKFNLEIPLKAEIYRLYFHALYRCFGLTSKSQHLAELCLSLAKEKIVFTNSYTFLRLKQKDESVIRLSILYDIAPYFLDVLNNDLVFDEIIGLIDELEIKCKNVTRNGILQFMGNVFKRKAFLYVNQTQCEVYYNEAEAYFKENQMMDEYCLTLICKAGTCIVIQQYEQAISLCDQVLSFMKKDDIELPQPQKIYNNKYIAEFLDLESKTADKNKCISLAKDKIKLLDNLLTNQSFTTEYVILTNICSLCLYVDDFSSYLKYKKKLEKLLNCVNVADIYDENIDDFYRYYFAWFEMYYNIKHKQWEKAKIVQEQLKDFVPALFKKQEKFWDLKLDAAEKIILNHKFIDAYDFCNNLVKLSNRATSLAKFFCRGLMLSDLQYTSYI